MSEQEGGENAKNSPNIGNPYQIFDPKPMYEALLEYRRIESEKLRRNTRYASSKNNASELKYFI